MPFPPLGRLSTRRGVPNDDDVLYEGVPDHLQGLLHDWTVKHLGLRESSGAVELDGRLQILQALAARYRVKVPWDHDPLMVIVNQIYENPEIFLEIVDAHLQTMKGGSERLDMYFTIGGSAWEVIDEPLPHLERRVSAEQRALYAAATTPVDDATEQLREAWAKVYGRGPDPSDAWDHAIKAVEILLQPIASPANDKATLGSMLAALEAKPEKWTLTLASSSKTVGPVGTFTAMLRLIWPNPDRHGSGSGSSRTPTREEAEQVVGLAVLVVSWLRKDALKPAAAPPPTGP